MAIDFKRIVEAAGIPTTEEGWQALFRQEVDAQGGLVNNDSPWSPFWKLIAAIVSKPATWLVNKLMIEIVLPNMFLQTATDPEFVEAKAWEHGLTRKAATKAVGVVQFSRAAATGPALLIPAGTAVQTDPVNGTIYRVLTLADAILPENELTLLVPVVAEQPGAGYNLGAGYYHLLPKTVTGIGSVTNLADWIDEPGADEETNDELKERTRNAFAAAGQWHIDATYRALLTERAGINSDNVFFEHEAPRGPGTANAYLLLDTGQPSAELLSDLNHHVMVGGYHGHGDDMQVLAMPGVNHDIGVVVYPDPALTADEVAALLLEVDAVIRCAFRENSNFYGITKTLPKGRFSFSKLGRELHRQFPGIDSLDWQQTDIVSAMSVPRIGTLTVTKGAI